MRFDTTVTFYREHGYDPSLHTTPDDEVVMSVPANVTDTGTQSALAYFGTLATRSKTIRTAMPIMVSWDYLMVADDTSKYKLATGLSPLKTHGLIVSEYIEGN